MLRVLMVTALVCPPAWPAGKAVDVQTGPTATPTVGQSVPSVNQTAAGGAPGSSVGAGFGTPTTAQPTDRSGRAEAESEARRVGGAASVNAPSLPDPAVAARSGRQTSSELSSAASQLGQVPPQDASTQQATLKKIYDAAAASGRVPDSGAATEPASAVAGSHEPAEAVVAQTTALAESASAYDAPQLYGAAAKAARSAADSGALAAATANVLVRGVLELAGRRASEALPKVANGAVAARSPRELERAMKALKAWQALPFPRPLIADFSGLRALIERARSQAGSGQEPTPGVAFAREGGSFAARLAPSRVPALPRLAVADLSKNEETLFASDWIDRAIAEHRRRRGSEAELFYQLARHAAARSVPVADASAASETARAWEATLWHWLRSLLGLERSPDAVAVLKRAPTRQERAAVAGSDVVTLDLARISRPYRQAEAFLARAGRERAALDGFLSRGGELAKVSQAITGDGSGLIEFERLAARLRAEGLASPVDRKLGEFWLERLREADLAAIARTAGAAPTLDVDLSASGGLLAVVASDRAPMLARLKFETIEEKNGRAVAWLDLAGADESARLGALEDAKAVVSGRSPRRAVDAGSASGAAAASFAFYAFGHRAAARRAAERLSREQPFARRRFVPVALVTAGGARYLVEASRRRTAGGLEQADVLAEPETLRPVLARLTIQSGPQ